MPEYPQTRNWNDITAYRRYEIEIAVDFITGLLKDQHSRDYTRGALDLFNRLIMIPVNMAKTPEEKDMLRVLSGKELEAFKVDLIRKVMFRNKD